MKMSSDRLADRPAPCTDEDGVTGRDVTGKVPFARPDDRR